MTFALKMLDRGIERAKQLKNGQPPWTSQKGKVALGFYSPLDGSVQPLLLTILPRMMENRLASTWSRRADRSGCSRATGFAMSRRPRTPRRPNGCTHAAGSCLQPAPNPSTTGAWNAGQFQLEVFARGNNANHWAGEVDIFESTAAVQRRFKIDDSRLVLRGFSLGGAGAWHIALHHPDRWAAAEIGAALGRVV